VIEDVPRGPTHEVRGRPPLPAARTLRRDAIGDRALEPFQHEGSLVVAGAAASASSKVFASAPIMRA
jgi:hypothetical protein